MDDSSKDSFLKTKIHGSSIMYSCKFFARKMYSFLFLLLKDCIANPEWCQTCAGGDDFKTTDCPQPTQCREHICTNHAHCRNGGICNILTGNCVCAAGFVGMDCALNQGKCYFRDDFVCLLELRSFQRRESG